MMSHHDADPSLDELAQQASEGDREALSALVRDLQIRIDGRGAVCGGCVRRRNHPPAGRAGPPPPLESWCWTIPSIM